MGKTFPLFSTDPVTQRRLREAHAARNAYIRSLLGALVRRCRALVTRARPAGGYSPLPLHAEIDPRP